MQRQPPGKTARADVHDILAWLLLAAVGVLALLTFREYAISNDEEVQHRYGELILAYYQSGMTDRSVFQYKNLYLYGALFDTLAVLLGRIVPADVFTIRHVMCAVTGIGGLAAVWATGRLIAGPRAGLLALAALAVCGPWFGSMFNHTKDIPFAAAMMGATYFLIRAARELPRPRLTDLALFGILLGAALGQRALGLLLVLYVPIAIAVYVPAPVTPSGTARFVFRSMLLFVPALALGYLIMLAAWPWAALNLFNPVRGLFAFAQFHHPIETLLAGRTFLMAEVPRWYIPAYLAIKLPIAVLLGAGIAILAAAVAFRQQRSRETVFVAFIAAFPVACQVIAHGPSFSGLRHFLFVLPPIAVLAGLGFDTAMAWLEAWRKAFAIAATAAITLALAWPAGQIVRLHPFEALYFNELVGGLGGASPRYDTDYWVNSMHEMVAGLEAYLDRERGQPFRWYYVAVCGERLPFEREAAARNSRLRWAEGNQPADFFIAPTHNRCDTAVDGRVVVTVERMGVPVGVVKDRRSITQPHLVNRN